ncbi:hypothetical protein [Caedibacter taeniospiralis]|jgi:hypothetical protein|uniref:hypothetical protein n=1 Tax=Caedibacter taeniospiralis TaxID=28907 RepID=UPI0037C0AF17
MMKKKSGMAILIMSVSVGYTGAQIAASEASLVNVQTNEATKVVDIPITLKNESSVDFYCNGLVINKELIARYKLASGVSVDAKMAAESISGVILKCYPQYLNFDFQIKDTAASLDFSLGNFSRMDYYAVKVSCTGLNKGVINLQSVNKGKQAKPIQCLKTTKIHVQFEDAEPILEKSSTKGG